jgi:hypothetical protein
VHVRLGAPSLPEVRFCNPCSTYARSVTTSGLLWTLVGAGHPDDFKENEVRECVAA